MICRLLKSIYGLKKSPRQWNKRFDDFMKAQGFTRNVYDPCVYMKKVNDSVFSWIVQVIYMDNMLVTASGKFEVARLKKLLSSEFKMKDLGYVKKILGMEVHRDKKVGKLWLT